ncbi:MAG: polysaccharide deacetylase family protein [Candidatus Methanoperedens sp.]|nr:polysaccharide deacetylase family protein [Candidatus Methanoperedens sp.]
MRKIIALTIDVEPDCPPYLHTYRGIEEGLPGLLSVLGKYDVEATLFVTGDVASRYPRQVEGMAQHYEIGCHGYSHARFDRMTSDEAVHEIEKSTEVLCRLAGRKIISFRAPNLIFPERFLKLLGDNGYLVDSSLAKYKLQHLYQIYAAGWDFNNRLLRVPVSATSSVLRLPLGNKIIAHLSSPVVLFFHPWEFVDMQSEPVRWDCRINTGSIALERLESVIKSFKASGYRFCTMADFLNL